MNWGIFQVSESNEKKYYSQTEIAKELKASQATISRIIRKNGITPAKLQGKRKLFSKEQVKQISFLLAGKKETKAKNVDDDNVSSEWKKEIKRLHEELSVKDNQINDLNEQLKMAQINLNQSQQLQLEQSKKIKELEAPKTEKKHWWQFWK